VKNILVGLMLLVSFPAMGATGPEQLVRETVESVVDELKANMGTFKSDPQTVYEMVVGAEQKPEIVSEFRQLLVRTYSSALFEYTDQELIFLPMEGSEAEGLVTVRIEIEQAGGFPIPINYTLRLGDNGWKVFDVSVDEVSLVTNYRSSFARAIKKDGVDGLIKTLQERNQE
jgi:phospholipid transport system substrate-binding protein